MPSQIEYHCHTKSFCVLRYNCHAETLRITSSIATKRRFFVDPRISNSLRMNNLYNYFSIDILMQYSMTINSKYYVFLSVCHVYSVKLNNVQYIWKIDTEVVEGKKRYRK